MNIKRILADPITHFALLVVGVVVATALVTYNFFPPRVEGVAPPASVYQASVDGVCSTVVHGFNSDEVWAGPLHGGELRRVDPRAVGVTGCRTDPDPSRR